MIVLTAIVTGLLHIGPWGIGGAVALVWLIYVVIEYSLAHPREPKPKPKPALVEGLPEPELVLPRTESVRVLSRGPKPKPKPKPEPVAVQVPTPEPEPEPELQLESEPEPIAAEPRQWNVWEIERGLRELGDTNEEREFLLIYLRDYAGPDGRLPLDFDVLVRESFPDDVLGTLAG